MAAGREACPDESQVGSIKEATLSGVKWSAIESISVKGVTFILGLLIARILEPGDYGLIGKLGIFMAVSQSLIDSGFSSALVRKLDRTETDYSTAFYFNVVIGLVCYLVLFLAAPYIAVFMKAPLLNSILKIYAVTLAINSLTVVQTAKLTIALDFKSLARVGFISSLVSGIAGLVMAYLGYGVWALVWQAIGGALLRAVLLWWMLRWMPGERFSRASFNSLFSYGGKIMASGLLHTIYSNFATFAIGKFYTEEQLGFYSRGSSLAAQPSGIITGVLMKVTYPILSQIQNDDAKLVSIYRKYIKSTSLVIMFCMTLLAALAKPLIIVLLKEKWLEATLFLQIFCFSLMFDHICQINLNLLQVKGRSDLFLKLEIIKKSIAFAILCASIPLGVTAICASAVIYTQIAVFINTYYTGKLFGLGYLKQLGDFMPYLGLSVVACAPALAMTFVPIHPIFQILVGAPIAASIYFLLLRKDDCMLEFISIAKEKTGWK